MKKFAVFMVVATLLLAGCAAQTAVPVDAPPAESPDIEAIVQQSVDEAIRETAAQYEEEQRARDAEIAELKAQLEVLTSQAETPPPEESPAPESEAASSGAPSQPPAAESSQPEPPSQPEPEKPAQSKQSASSSGGGFDLKNLYPSYVWENYQPSEEPYNSDDDWKAGDDDTSDDESPENPTGFSCEDDALEVIRLTNIERENHGLEPLEIDDDLMALAQIRAEEVSIKYSHERPDGTRVVAEHLGYGENVGAKASAEKQVTSWMNSEGHCANILRERYHHIGVGCYQTADGKHYWVQIFSK